MTARTLGARAARHAHRRTGRLAFGSRWWLAVAMVVALLPSGLAAGGIREDEFACEEAVAHLDECCDGFAEYAVQCTYNGGCGDGTRVALSTADSACIQDLDCDAIADAHICERVAQLGVDAGPATGGDAGARADVCP